MACTHLAVHPRPAGVGGGVERRNDALLLGIGDAGLHAQQKLERKGLDAIVANDVTAPGAGFGTDTNQVTVLTRAGLQKQLTGTKREVAQGILELLLTLAPAPAGQGPVQC